MGLLLFSGLAAASGSGAGAQPAAAPSAPFGFAATLTAYNAVPAQTDSDPGTTADGGPAVAGVVAARSQDLGDELPFGTVIEITPTATSSTCGYEAVAPEIGYRVITDTMNVRYHDRVDVLFGTKDPILMPDGRTINAASALGVCSVSVAIVGHIDLAHTPLPESQAELAALIGKSALALR